MREWSFGSARTVKIVCPGIRILRRGGVQRHATVGAVGSASVGQAYPDGHRAVHELAGGLLLDVHKAPAAWNPGGGQIGGHGARRGSGNARLGRGVIGVDACLVDLDTARVSGVVADPELVADARLGEL